MNFKIKGFPDLLDAPGGNPIVPQPNPPLSPNMSVNGTGNESGNFVEVKVANQTGWLAKANLIGGVRDDINEEAFVRECIIAERAVNELPTTKPWFVLADFLIARALIETRPTLVNAGNKLEGSDAVGPLQVSSAEWQNFLANGGALKEGYEKSDFDNYLMQVWGAAFTMFVDAKAITKVRRDAGEGSVADPPLPSYLEIYLAYLTKSPKAAVALADATATPKDKGDDSAGVQAAPAASSNKLNDFLKTKNLMSDAEIATLFRERTGFTGTNDANANTVGDFVGAVTTSLNQALRDAFGLINTHAPETILPVGQGPAPWFEVAKAEKAKGIKEGIAAGDARILEYFKAINFQTTTSKTPWCAAFASFCMIDTAKPQVAKSVPNRDPALAVSWKSWGEPLPMNSPTIPTGAVVVLKPTENSDSSGHVTFYVSGDVNTVTCLGGNQSNAVKESTYARSRVTAIRWLDLSEAPAAPGQVANIKLGSLTAKQQEMATLIVQKFAAAGFGGLQQIAAVANAMKESSLNPGIRTTTAKEDSVGLFQLNMRGGLGQGHGPDELADPNRNTDLIIAKCKRVREFGRASSLSDAVAAFVHFVEIPANQDAEIKDRLAKAKSLLP